MTEEDASAELGDISHYVEEIGDSVLDEKSFQQDDESVDILFCRHGNSGYEIVDEPSKPYFTIKYGFNLTKHIAFELSEEQISERTDIPPEDFSGFKQIDELDEVDELDGESEVVIPQGSDNLPPQFEAQFEAAEDVIESVDEEVLERFKLNLFQELSHPEVATALTHTTNDYFNGFVISRKIFPEDSGFTLTEFNKTVQAVISVGTFGGNWVSQFLGELDGFEDIGTNQED
ncbi:MAG: hypothetical protein ABEI86_06980 [Halobacteriaceae archaeon]